MCAGVCRMSSCAFGWYHRKQSYCSERIAGKHPLCIGIHIKMALTPSHSSPTHDTGVPKQNAGISQSYMPLEYPDQPSCRKPRHHDSMHNTGVLARPTPKVFILHFEKHNTLYFYSFRESAFILFGRALCTLCGTLT